MASRIEGYAMIGDLGSAALIGRDGSIDWLCWPRFDSDACFAALLGKPENGRWQIAPADGAATSTRCYRDGSLILETRFETETGIVTVIDFMPLRDSAIDLVRIVRGDEGSIEMAMELVLRFGYGADVPWVTQPEPGVLRAIAGPDMVVLRSPVVTEGEAMKTVARFTVAAGDSVPFVLSHRRSHLPMPGPVDPEKSLAETEAFWRD